MNNEQLISQIEGHNGDFPIKVRVGSNQKIGITGVEVEGASGEGEIVLGVKCPRELAEFNTRVEAIDFMVKMNFLYGSNIIFRVGSISGDTDAPQTFVDAYMDRTRPNGAGGTNKVNYHVFMDGGIEAYEEEEK